MEPKDIKVAIIHEDGPHGVGVAQATEQFSKEQGLQVVLREVGYDVYLLDLRGYGYPRNNRTSTRLRWRACRADPWHAHQAPALVRFHPPAPDRIRRRARIHAHYGKPHFGKLTRKPRSH
ncbi:MAG TPA: hypothetical protein VKE24_05870 [Candidatus Acidoferrales bacterium]|nr:hypothetical protein [Candidatus Acidoferrales bacterium]